MSQDTLMMVVRVTILLLASLIYYYFKDTVYNWFTNRFCKAKNTMINDDDNITFSFPDDEYSKFSEEMDEYLEQLLENEALCPQPSEAALALKDGLTDESFQYLEKVQNVLTSEYRFGDRWHYDQESAAISFFEDEKLILKAKAQILGTYSQNSNTWLWSFFNESILESAQDELFIVWKTLLTMEELFPIAYPVSDLNYLSQMLAISVFMAQAKGAYIAKNEVNNSQTYFIITDVLPVE